MEKEKKKRRKSSRGRRSRQQNLAAPRKIEVLPVGWCWWQADQRLRAVE
jgi:hypothetical protein